jgi:hypothetical protein
MTPEEQALAALVQHLEQLTIPYMVTGSVASSHHGRPRTTHDILSKLEWAQKGGGSEKQLADVAGIREIQGPRLDEAYVERWAQELGLLDLWLNVTGRQSD